MHSSGIFKSGDLKRQAGAPRVLGGSKSLASMLPALLMSGVVTLVVCAIMRLAWLGFDNDFFAAWMEAWLITWPIAFPIAYVSAPLIKRFICYL